MSTIDEIRDTTPNQLARMADCDAPDSQLSPGAIFLSNVRDAFLERYDDGSYDDDTACEIADDAPSIYTYTLWKQFTDLAAWQEDISDLSDPSGDMNRNASIALYMIAERLVRALHAEMEAGR